MSAQWVVAVQVLGSLSHKAMVPESERSSKTEDLVAGEVQEIGGRICCIWEIPVYGPYSCVIIRSRV